MLKLVCSIKRFGVEPDYLLILKRGGDGSYHTMKLSAHCGCIPNIHYFVANDKQPGIMGHDVDEHDEHLVPLSMEELCNLE